MAPSPSSRRWTLVVLLAAATFINYLDRGSLAVALPTISKELHLTPFSQGVALSSFFWAYTAMQIPMGWIVDRYDIRKVYGVAFTLWSISAASTGLVRGFGDLLLCRVLLGLGESVYLPGGVKAVTLEFGTGETAWPIGLFDLGAKVGLAAGTAIDVYLLVHFGWRSLFFRTGLAGLIWLAPWLVLGPRSSRASRPAPAPTAWGELFRNRTLLAISLGFFCWDYFWYFLVSWLPSYLINVRHVSLSNVAIAGSLPFLIFAVAEGAGAWAARAAIARGADVSRVTKGWIAAGFSCGLLVLPAALVSTSAASLAFLFAACISGIACGNLLAVPRFFASDDEVALWTGFQNFVGNVGGLLAPFITGALIQFTGSYLSSFVLVSLALVVGIFAYTRLVPRLVIAKVKEAGAVRQLASTESHVT
jgi:MFS family permease